MTSSSFTPNDDDDNEKRVRNERFDSGGKREFAQSPDVNDMSEWPDAYDSSEDDTEYPDDNPHPEGGDILPPPPWVEDTDGRWWQLFFAANVGEGDGDGSDDSDAENREYSHSLLRYRIEDDQTNGSHVTSDTVVDLERVR